LGHRLGPGLSRPARLFRPQRTGDRRHRSVLHLRHRPGEAPVAHPQQRPRFAAGLHPRRGAARTGVSTAGRGAGTDAPPAPAPAADSRMAPLRTPSFRGLMAYRICTILSYQVVAVTVGWHVYELTRNPWMLGLIGLAELIPYFCVAPFAGYLVDHLPRRKLGMVACIGLAVTPAVLALIASGVLGEVRLGCHRLRAVTGVLAVGLLPAAVGHVRRRVRGAALDHPAAGDPRRDARPGVVDQRAFRGVVQRAGGVLCRLDGAPAGPGAGRGAGRLRDHDRGRGHGLARAETAAPGPARAALSPRPRGAATAAGEGPGTTAPARRTVPCRRRRAAGTL